MRLITSKLCHVFNYLSPQKERNRTVELRIQAVFCDLEESHYSTVYTSNNESNHKYVPFAYRDKRCRVFTALAFDLSRSIRLLDNYIFHAECRRLVKLPGASSSILLLNVILELFMPFCKEARVTTFLLETPVSSSLSHICNSFNPVLEPYLIWSSKILSLFCHRSSLVFTLKCGRT